MSRTTKRQINNAIKMSDGTFGITLHLREFMNEPIYVETMLVEVKNNGEIVRSFVLLPHQLYLQDLLEMSKNGEYDVFVTPICPEQKPIKIFEDKD